LNPGDGSKDLPPKYEECEDLPPQYDPATMVPDVEAEENIGGKRALKSAD